MTRWCAVAEWLSCLLPLTKEVAGWTLDLSEGVVRPPFVTVAESASCLNCGLDF